MPLEFFEGPMDGRTLQGVVDGTAHHQGDGVYLIEDEDGNVVAEAKFEDGPPPPHPEVWKAMQIAELRRRRVTLIITIVAIVVYLGSAALPGPPGRLILDGAFCLLMAAVLIRR